MQYSLVAVLVPRSSREQDDQEIAVPIQAIYQSYSHLKADNKNSNVHGLTAHIKAVLFVPSDKLTYEHSWECMHGNESGD